MKRLFLLLLCLGSASAATFAAERTWTSSNGRFNIDAELVDFDDGKAHLKKTDGALIEVPLVSLCEKDRKYVKEQFPGVEEENFRPGAEYREWKSKNGKFTTVAEFLSFADGVVQLRKPDGSELSVEKKLLDLADQRWIVDELRRQREEDDESKPAEKAAVQELAGQIAAQEISMKLVRFDQPKGKSRAKTSVPAEYLLRLTSPQQFFMQLGNGNGNLNEAEFQSLVGKEPDYNAPVAFRGVAKLGSRSYCFAMDTTDAKDTGYTRLYFDLNGNGDLTDDKPIAAATTNTPGPGITQAQFPRVDISLDIDGRSLDYSFLMSAICHRSAAEAYASVSLYSAAVQEGWITQGTKRTRLLLLDHNSNGRFDDTMSVNSARRVAEGDLLLINPNPKNKLSNDATMGRDRNFVAKLICLGKGFYRLEIAPGGDTVKLSPTKLALGSVANASPAYRAVLFCEDYGVVMLSGTKDQKIPLPEGTWKILNYTIDASGGGSGTAVAATFAENSATVTVRENKTAEMPFGAPFRAVVSARRIKPGKVSLSLAIVGAAGEQCTSFYVNGSRPPQPRFIIKDSEAKTVAQGAFEYG